MANGALGHVLRYLRRWADAPGDDLSDGGLLTRFVTEHDAAAFSELVRRHGPAVMGVCRRLLQHTQDAEDAFQATFLILARKARSISKRPSIGSWLYGVALRTALKARTHAARRRLREREASAMTAAEPPSDPSWDDLRPVLDVEVGRLPEKFRAPVVLCYLEGKSNAEAARELGWPVGTVKTRLTQARELLRERLNRRGIALTAAALGVFLEEHAAAAVAPTLVEATSSAALQSLLGNSTAASAEVAALVKGVSRAMLMSKLQVATVAVLAAVVIGAGAVGLLTGTPAAPPAEPIKVAAADAVNAAPEPLPAGAVARFGTSRLRHPQLVRSAVLSPDGSLLASGGQEGIVRLWDTKTGTEVRQLSIKVDQAALDSREPDGSIHVVALNQYILIMAALPSLAFSPDGKQLAAACSDSTIHVWDVASGKRVQQLKGHKREVLSVAFAGDGNTLASCGVDNTVRLWDVAAGKEIKQLAQEKNWPIAVALTPDGKTLAMWNGQEVALLDCASGKEMHRSKATVNASWTDRDTGMSTVKGLAFAPDGRTLAVWTEHQKTTLLDRTGKEIRSIPDGGAVGFSADGKTLVTGGAPGSFAIRLWDVENGREKASIETTGTGQFEYVGLTRDGKTLAAHSRDQVLRFYDVETRKERLTGPGHRSRVTTLAATPDGKLLASAARDGISLWETATGKELRHLDPAGGVHSLALTPDGKRLVTSEGCVKLWDTITGKMLTDLKEPVDPDSRPIAIDSGSPPPYEMAISPDGTMVVGARPGTVANVWETATGKHLRKLTVAEGTRLYSYAFSPDGKTLAAGTNQGFLFWEVATFKERGHIAADKHLGYQMVFSPDSRTLISLGRVDHHVKVWDVGTGKELHDWPAGKSRPSAIGLGYTSDGKPLVVTSAGESVLLRDVAAGKEVGQRNGEQGGVNALLIVNSGKYLISAGTDTTVLVWDLGKMPNP